MNNLTERQREIVRGLALSQTRKEIACSLGISSKTVDAHMPIIAAKLGVLGRDCAGITRYAIQQGIIKLDPDPADELREALRRMVLFAECLWADLPYEKRKDINWRDRDNANRLLYSNPGTQATRVQPQEPKLTLPKLSTEKILAVCREARERVSKMTPEQRQNLSEQARKIMNEGDVTSQLNLNKLKHLAAEIGYGAAMHEITAAWAETAKGSEFTIGTCKAMTTPCGCKNRVECDWCCGSGWLTKHVKKIKNMKRKVKT